MDIKSFLNHKELENKSRNTIISYESDLKDFMIFKENQEITEDLVRGYLAQLRRKNLATSTLRRRFSTIKEFLMFSKMSAHIPNIKMKVERKLPEYLTTEEVQEIVKKLNNVRDRLIVTLLFNTGLRISELLSINEEDLDSAKLKITGKGSKERMVFISKKLKSKLDKLKMGQKGPLFRNRGEGRLSVAYVERTVRKAGLNALDRRVVPHMLRHSFATRLHGAGMDILSISKILGHADISTTQIYTHIENKKLEEEFNKYWGDSPLG